MNIRFLLVIFIFFAQSNLVAMEVKHFDVGQGMGTIVTCHNQPSTISDAGSSQHPINDITGKSLHLETIESMVTYVKEKTPSKEVCIIISHGDKDHYNWIPLISKKLLRNGFELKFLLGGKKSDYNIIIPCALNPTSVKKAKLTDIFKALDTKYRNKIAIKYVEETQKPISGTVNNYLPSYCNVIRAKKNAKNSNDKSIILKVNHDNFSTLLLGDATYNAQKKILTKSPYILRSDTLNLSHHGAELHDCTTPVLLAAVNPNIIICSAGMYKNYNHPALKTVQKTINHLHAKPFHRPHSFTFHGGTSDIHADYYPKKHDELESEKLFKKIVHYSDGFAVGVTTYALYNTNNMGNITCKSDGNVEVDNSASVNDQAGMVALKAVRPAYLGSIRSLCFSHMNISSNQLCDNFTQLPPHLQYFNLRSNKIGKRGISHLFSLLKGHQTKLVVKLDENKSINENQINEIASQKRASLSNLIVATTMSATAQKTCVDTLIASPPSMTCLVDTQPSNKKFNKYYKKWQKDFESKLVNAKILVNNERNLAAVYKNNKLKIWDLKKYFKVSEDQKNYKPIVIEVKNLKTMEFSLSGSHMAAVNAHGTLIVDLQTKKGITRTTILPSNSLINATQPEIIKTGKIIRLLNPEKAALFKSISPITRNNEFILGIDTKRNDHIILTPLADERLDEAYFDIQHLFGRSTADIKNLFFTDDDETIRIEYHDGSFSEIPDIFNMLKLKIS